MTVSNSAVSFMDATIHPPHSWLSQHWPWDGLQNGARAEVTSPEAPSGVTASHHIDAFGYQRSDFVCDIVCGCVWLASMLNSLQGPRASRPASPAVSIAASHISGNNHILGTG
jgi:hypothetical protein